MRIKAQAILEFTVIFVIMAALVMGLLHLWQWSSSNIVMRQKRYNSTRLQAGSSSSPGEPSGSGLFQAGNVSVGKYYLK